MVWIEIRASVNPVKPWIRQNVWPKTQRPSISVPNTNGIHRMPIKESLIAKATTNILEMVLRRWLRYTAQQTSMFPKIVRKTIRPSTVDSKMTLPSSRSASSWDSSWKPIVWKYFHVWSILSQGFGHYSEQRILSSCFKNWTWNIQHVDMTTRNDVSTSPTNQTVWLKHR